MKGVRIEDCFVKKETEKAILVVIPSVEEKWIPKSQVHDDSEIWKEGMTGCLVITQWLAEKNGWD